MAQIRTVVCKVKTSGSDNVTNTVCGKRASCTMSPRAAAERLAEKLFRPPFSVIELDTQADAFVRVFSMHGVELDGVFR